MKIRKGGEKWTHVASKLVETRRAVVELVRQYKWSEQREELKGASPAGGLLSAGFATSAGCLLSPCHTPGCSGLPRLPASRANVHSLHLLSQQKTRAQFRCERLAPYEVGHDIKVETRDVQWSGS